MFRRAHQKQFRQHCGIFFLKVVNFVDEKFRNFIVKVFCKKHFVSKKWPWTYGKWFCQPFRNIVLETQWEVLKLKFFVFFAKGIIDNIKSCSGILSQKRLLKIQEVSTKIPKKKKLNFSSEHVECSFSTTLKIYCSKTEAMKNNVTLFPANISHKTFLWTRIMQSWQPWQKVIAQNRIVYHSKSKLFFFVVSAFFLQKLLWICRRQFDSPAKFFLLELSEKSNLVEFVRKMFTQMVQLWTCNKTFRHSCRIFPVKSRRFS